MVDGMQKCNLCNMLFGSLQKSHIVSECFYKYLYDAKHRYIPISSNSPESDLCINQSGYKESLLCMNCENKLSKWEKILYNDLEDISKGNSKFLNIKILDNSTFLVSNIRYNEFKKAVLSIFWRASISSLKVFNAYQFGAYNELLRIVLLNDLFVSTLRFSIKIEMGVLNGLHAKGMMSFFPKGKYNDFVSVYRMIINGFDFTLYLTEDKMPKDSKVIFLQDNGTVYIQKTHIEKICAEGGVFDRLNTTEVKDKMNKLIPK